MPSSVRCCEPARASKNRALRATPTQMQLREQAAKQCEAMRANTRKKNSALGATKLACFGENHTNRERARQSVPDSRAEGELHQQGETESTPDHACLSRRSRAPPKRTSSLRRCEPTHEKYMVPSEPPNLSALVKKSYQRSSVIDTPRFDGLKLRLVAS
jgi:hypothetical protein